MIGTIFFLLIVPLAILILRNIRKSEKDIEEQLGVLTTNQMIAFIEQQMVEITTQYTDSALAEENLTVSRQDKLIRELDAALTSCVQGVPSAVALVKNQIKSLLNNKYKDEDLMKHELFNFKNPATCQDPYIQFEVLMNRLNRIAEYDSSREEIPDVIGYLNDKYDLLELIPTKYGSEWGVKREWDAYKLAYMYRQEVLEGYSETYPEFSRAEALDVFTNIIFATYKGYRKVDTLFNQRIDGIEVGSSGSVRSKYIVETAYKGNETYFEPGMSREEISKFSREGKPIAYGVTNSVWFQIKASWIHCSFLNMNSIDEVKMTIMKFSEQGASLALTENNPLKVVELHDNSRVTVVRPSAGESWFLAVRKFSSSLNDIDILLSGAGVKNWQLVKEFLKYSILGELNQAVTGGQNTGKTTLMKDMFCFAGPFNIRAIEMSFELELRQLYPTRNSFTMKPTPTVTFSNIQDQAKKMDSYITTVGEVATDDVVPRLEQAANVGSAFVLYSHHGNDDTGLVLGLAGSMIAAGAATDMRDAIQRVLSFMCLNTHLKLYAKKDRTLRIIEYISEIVPEPTMQPYLDPKDTGDVAKNIHEIAKLMKENAQRTTDRKTHFSRYIFKYDEKTNSYQPGEGLTARTLERLLTRLPADERPNFVKFYRKWWLDRKVGLVYVDEE